VEEIKSEFKNYLSTLVESYPKATETVLENPLRLSDIGVLSRDFNTKSQQKIEELAGKNSVSLTKLKVELMELQVVYHGVLMRERL